MPNKASSPRKKPTRQELRDLDLEISFMEGILRRDASYVEALRILGDNYTKRGRFAEGLRIDERLSRLCPDDSLVYYNLACSYSLTDQFDLATEALETAISLGYRDFKWMAKDPDLKKLRDQSEYRRIRAKVRQLLQEKAR
jgi:tetratricopeptide (TPR) repeat protein